jgi:hypothetical protein
MLINENKKKSEEIFVRVGHAAHMGTEKHKWKRNLI